MNSIKSAFGTSASGTSVGDQSLYYGLQGAGAAPWQTATFVRVGAVVATITLSLKDAYPKLSKLGQIATTVVSRLKDVLAGKLHATVLAADDASKLPPKGPDLTLLGAVKLPVEAIVVMLNFAAPETLSGLLRQTGADSIVFGDYVLDNDTHMEIRAGVMDFNSAQFATDWIDALRGTNVSDAAGIASFYDASTGQYFTLFTVGTKGAMLVCRSTAEGEAASRSCEVPLSRVAPAWQFSLNAR
jgi:hypothetical protein